MVHRQSPGARPAPSHHALNAPKSSLGILDYEHRVLSPGWMEIVGVRQGSDCGVLASRLRGGSQVRTSRPAAPSLGRDRDASRRLSLRVMNEIRTGRKPFSPTPFWGMATRPGRRSLAGGEGERGARLLCGGSRGAPRLLLQPCWASPFLLTCYRRWVRGASVLAKNLPIGECRESRQRASKEKDPVSGAFL